ncbi:MAG: anti-sigma factor [Deltaproteobacteria bacterium]
MIDDNLRERLSAYLDGELSREDAAAIEALVASDPDVTKEFGALSQLEQGLLDGFGAMLDEPVPPQLERAVQLAQAIEKPANLSRSPRFGLRSLAAALGLLVIGAGSGALIARATLDPVAVVAQTGWLDQVAAYHKVYAAQTNHLVEVSASDATLAGWLAKSTGVSVEIPDLSAQGLTFQGGRLLVAGGKPVAQLMYTDANGEVVALCYVAGGDAALGNGVSDFKTRDFDGFQMVSWVDSVAAYVVIGPKARTDLKDLAELTSKEL